MDKYAGQFLLTRIMKKLSPDSLRQFYRLIPVEMKKTKFARMISNQINPYADNCIRQADDLLSLTGGPIETNKYTEEAYKLYEQGVRLDPERTDGYIALATMYERLLPIKGAKPTTYPSLTSINSSKATSGKKTAKKPANGLGISNSGNGCRPISIRK